VFEPQTDIEQNTYYL